MRSKRRRSVKRLGPVRINRSGLTRITSITVPISLLGRTLVLWERRT